MFQCFTPKIRKKHGKACVIIYLKFNAKSITQQVYRSQRYRHENEGISPVSGLT